jgi:hypothetical protein
VANRRKQQNDIGYKRKEQKKHVQALSGQTQQDGVLAEEIARSTFACGTSIVMQGIQPYTKKNLDEAKCASDIVPMMQPVASI